MRRPHVVVIGGGFGGLQAARGLRRLPVDVTLVDRKNHHVFQPLLYQVATAGLSPAEIAAPIRHILRRQRATRVLLGEVTAVDLAAKTVKLDSLELAYDYLILATGEVHSYFGHDEWQAHAHELDSGDRRPGFEGSDGPHLRPRWRWDCRGTAPSRRAHDAPPRPPS